MARYANEDAVAQSSRSFSQVDGGGELPWSPDTVELIDDLAAERLPAHLLDPGRGERDEQAARRRKVAEDRAWLAEQLPELAAMGAEQRAEVAAEAERRFGKYSSQNWQLRDRVRDLDAADQPAEEADAQPAAGEGAEA
jgi:predicted RNase H-like nuclease